MEKARVYYGEVAHRGWYDPAGVLNGVTATDAAVERGVGGLSECALVLALESHDAGGDAASSASSAKRTLVDTVDTERSRIQSAPRAVLRSALAAVDSMLLTSHPTAAVTVVAALLTPPSLIVATIGEGSVVLVKKRPKRSLNALQRALQWNFSNDATASTEENVELSTEELAIPKQLDDRVERERVMEHNGELLSLADTNGKPTGPPRLFRKGSKGPALPVARCLGCKSAKAAGAIAEPCLRWIADIRSHAGRNWVPYLLIACTTGIWKSLPRFEAASMLHNTTCSSSYGETPEGTAASELIDQAHSRSTLHKQEQIIEDASLAFAWLVRPAFLQDFPSDARRVGIRDAGSTPSTNSDDLNEHRKSISSFECEHEKMSRKQKDDVSRHMLPDADVRFLIHNMRNFFIFKDMPEAILRNIASRMRKVHYRRGRYVVLQGEVGSDIFVVGSGRLEALVDGVRSKEYTSGNCFGELAALYNSVRQASVRAVEDVDLYAASNKQIKRAARGKPGSPRTMFLRDLPLMREVPGSAIAEVEDELSTRSLKPVNGSRFLEIVRIGDMLNEVLIVRAGEVKAVPAGATIEQAWTLPTGGLIGERSALYNQPCRMSYYATGPVQLLVMPLQTFRDLAPLCGEHLKTHLTLQLARSVPELASLDDSELSDALENFQWQTLEKHSALTMYGESSECLYILNTGRVAVEDADGNVLLKSSGAFGTTALHLLEQMPSEMETAIVASERAEFLVLDRNGCDTVMSSVRHRSVVQALKRVTTFSRLSDFELDAIASDVELKNVEAGEILIHQNEPTGGADDGFYIVYSGEFCVRKWQDASDVQEIARVAKNDTFGERALVHSGEPRTAEVICRIPGLVFILRRASFERHFAGGLHGKQLQQKADWDFYIQELKSISLSDILPKQTIGIGMLGRVRLAVNRKTGDTYALKAMSKHLIIKHKQEQHVKDERDVMARLSHPFCIILLRTFKDTLRVYLLEEFVQGGDLSKHLQRQGRLGEEQARFYVACLVLALEHVHSKSVAYRDLKPENVLIDKTGYIKLTDFGFAKHVTRKTYTVCGTPEYVAPEILTHQGHGETVDWWSLGVLLYEMLLGVTPFAPHSGGRNQDIFNNIMSRNFQAPSNSLVSQSGSDFCNRLLNNEPEQRLGGGLRGARDIRRHSWLQGLDWNLLGMRKYKAPYVPELSNPVDTSHFSRYNEKEALEPPQQDTNWWDSDF